MLLLWEFSARGHVRIVLRFLLLLLTLFSMLLALQLVNVGKCVGLHVLCHDSLFVNTTG